MYLSHRVKDVFLAGVVHEQKLSMFLVLLLQVPLEGQFLLLLLLLKENTSQGRN